MTLAYESILAQSPPSRSVDRALAVCLLLSQSQSLLSFVTQWRDLLNFRSLSLSSELFPLGGFVVATLCVVLLVRPIPRWIMLAVLGAKLLLPEVVMFLPRILTSFSGLGYRLLVACLYAAIVFVFAWKTTGVSQRLVVPTFTSPERNQEEPPLAAIASAVPLEAPAPIIAYDTSGPAAYPLIRNLALFVTLLVTGGRGAIHLISLPLYLALPMSSSNRLTTTTYMTWSLYVLACLAGFYLAWCAQRNEAATNWPTVLTSALVLAELPDLVSSAWLGITAFRGSSHIFQIMSTFVIAAAYPVFVLMLSRAARSAEV